MPELPEVETVRKDLLRLLRGSRIVDVVIQKKKMVHGSARNFQKIIKGKTIHSIKRRGKLLIFHFTNEDQFLLIHLKMTGQLICRDKKKLVGGGHGEPKVNKEELPNKYSHIVFSLTNGGKLFFNDMRQFGYVRLVNEKELNKVLGNFGVEPLSKYFTVEVLRNLFKKRKTSLKSVLLNQTLLAGLGNIYVDEACYMAGIRPTRKAARVTEAEAKRLHSAIIRILKKSIANRGTTFSSYRDGLGGEGAFVRLLKVYGRAGKPCYKCKTALKKVKVSGRGTVYCSKCQK
jgi:formamidopyrimidine-DNA glycosylase